MSINSLPILDMHLFIQGSLKQREEFINNLRHTGHNIGFFYIKNHGINPALLNKMLVCTNAFFNLPLSEKEKSCISNSPQYRGYGRLRAESTQLIPDYKESYDLGLEQEAQKVTLAQPYLVLHGKNQWPSHPSLIRMQWKETILEYIRAMQQLGESLMTAIALALYLPEHYFTNKFSRTSQDAFAMLRLLRYPPGRVKNNSTETELGVGPHIDVGCLAILLQDAVGGLQVQNCSGQWVDAPPVEDTFVINIGEMLQIWSNNYFLATPHRVINYASEIRHSVPFFLEPNLSTQVRPLPLHPQLVSQMNRSIIASDTAVVYGEHMLGVYKRSFKKPATSVEPAL